MNNVYKIFLLSVSFNSFLFCMEPSAPALSQLSNNQQQSLNELFNLSRDVLANNQNIGKSGIFCDSATVTLFNTLEKINALESKNLSITEAGKFFYHKPESFTEGLRFHHSQCTPSHIAILLRIFENYSSLLKKNQFVTPTYEQYKNYISNKAIEANYQVAIQKAPAFGIFLSEEIIQKNNVPFIHVPLNSATQEFENLIKHIQAMCHEKPEIIKYLAELLYVNNHTAH